MYLSELRSTRGFFLAELTPYVQLAKNIPVSCLFLADLWSGKAANKQLL